VGPALVITCQAGKSVRDSILATSAMVPDRSRVRLCVGGERHPGGGEAKSRSSIVPMEFLPDRRRPRVEAFHHAWDLELEQSGTKSRRAVSVSY
jgi:hypothetical protein